MKDKRQINCMAHLKLSIGIMSCFFMEIEITERYGKKKVHRIHAFR